MWRGLLVLALFDAGGELLARAGVPVPGPVLGMGALLAFLMLRERVSGLDAAADFLLRHLALFFVPATVGAIALIPSLRHTLVPIGVALVASTLIGLVIAAVVFQLVAKDRA
ncbi:MAG: CidA/LrgA family protein [Polyangia bacterium]